MSASQSDSTTTGQGADAAEPEGPWYRDGLRFECTQCGRCCGGAPGFVWVSLEEVQRLRQATGLANRPDEFDQLYLRQVGTRLSLKEYGNGDCVLLDRETRRCRVYEARPTQCRTWPFWDSCVDTPQQWQQTAEHCPGCNNGPLYSLQLIEANRLKRSL